ncbi:MBL fold metallo-hydrolase [Rapidithrix thailandica]|uniref:MBL fold metallo-hydrolase n=1 Tax=Rapidithrix thailandica TaxID=413964 RepID=A0AAW9S198_9BACT
MKKAHIMYTLLALAMYSCKSMDVHKPSGTIQLIRNATVVVELNNQKLLVDPILADKGTEPPIPFSNQLKNPTISLPVDKMTLVRHTDAVLLTHYHPDHFDQGAEKIIPKEMLIFCQPGDDEKLKAKGFHNLQVVDSTVQWEGVVISRFRASHHEGATGEPPFGESSSFHLQTDRESIFFTGDAVFDTRLKASLKKLQPPVIVANSGECTFSEENPVLAPGVTMTLTTQEIKEMARFFPGSKIIAVHMDAINHCGLSKQEMRQFIEKESLNGQIVVPDEGDTISYSTLRNN